ncbi:hypothetical protein [Nocardia gamkensis]|uniref:Uncharacterized protein n=1 Tax=Nocardia gamkensis TaxID=352869 RepID=A0A7X6L4Y0_9NOCA|nr:hypothetical protein [Nocardia gamkensis]NKY27837.1 hypothetical protein [Nocardia gamkensis]NQE67481.1 hypothetical protein [Nocardia gamkensis]
MTALFQRFPALSCYAAVLTVLTWQALRGQSVAHPDAATLAAFAATALGATALTASALRPKRVAVQKFPAGVNR